MNLSTKEMQSVTVKITKANAPTLKKYRLTAEVRQTMAGKTFGIAQSTYSKVENGLMPGFLSLTAMVKTLGETATHEIMKAGR